MRRLCASCLVPIDGGRPPRLGPQISHGVCDTCGGELYGELWSAHHLPGRWSGRELAAARRRAGHSSRRMARDIGVAPSTVSRNEHRDRITAYVQRRLYESRRAVYYHSLVRGTAPRTAHTTQQEAA